MPLKIAINGFGRIGRCVLRALIEQGVEDIDVVAINDPSPPETLAHLLRYDSVHGRLRAPVFVDGDVMTVGRHRIRMTAIRAPADLPWADVDVAYECTGFFTDREKAALHLRNGSKRVLVSAPAKNVDRTVVFGFNHDALVSIDFNHDPHSSCFAAPQTTVTAEGMARVVSWYDNEWGFSRRMIDTGRAIGRLVRAAPMLQQAG